MPALPSSAYAALLAAGVLAALSAAVVLVARSRRRHARAATDEITGLLTRGAFLEALEAWPVSRQAAVVIADVDRFSEINETYGADVADRLLADLAHRIARSAPDAVAARWGADEFAIVVPGVNGRQALAELGNTFARALHAPVTLLGNDLNPSVHLAVGGFPDQAQRWPDLLRRVDLTVRRAKGTPRTVEVYDPRPDSASVKRLAIVGELRQAIRNDELRLRYQPRVRLADGAIVGAEALVRWRHPKRGLLQPGAFIPAAEAAGLIGDLTRRVLALAIGDAAEWNQEGHALSVAVNLSAEDLRDVGLLTFVEDLLESSGLPPELVTLEVTESAFMADAALGGELLSELARLGVTVAIDDFGTGYSSLSRVAAMPARELKIDRGFVNELWSPGSAAVVNATIELAHSLDMKVVAEGVETAEQYSRLIELGCDEAQGYWLGKPMALAQFLKEATLWDQDSNGRAAAPVPIDHELLERNDALDAVLDLERTPASRIDRVRHGLDRFAARIGVGSFIGGLVAAVAYLAWVMFHGPAGEQSGIVDGVVRGALSGAVGVLCWRTATRLRGQAIQAWGVLAGAMGLLAAADLTRAFSSPTADVVHFAVGGLSAVAVLSLPARPLADRRERLAIALDASVIAVAAATMLWFTVAPLLDGPHALGSSVLLHPVGDLVIIVAVAIAILREQGPVITWLRWAGAGLLGLALVDALRTWFAARGPYTGNAIVDFGQQLAVMCIAVGAVHALIRTPAEPAPPGRHHRSAATWFVYGGSVAVETLLVVTAWQSQPSLPLRGALSAAVLLMLLVTTRQVLGLQDNQELVDQFTALARTDPLTGLANRRRLMEEGERLFERCRRSGEPIAALMVDVDHFKLVNDSHGHAVGDAVLRHIADLCIDNVRMADLVGRYGGDEIVVLLAGANAQTAFELGQRLNHIASDSAPAQFEFVPTVSIGAADSASAISLGGLIRNADRALYEAKRAGRNQTVAYKDSLLAIPGRFS
jgi:diguanylate cyclase (GGDEF)-like protein